ncbi:TlpA family protein disulfide reductase [Leifsonia sp. PS1209]|uniref:TlpA family protein disulfide reductase n=1 Tax=Leifsonia sp. PS1209 TaxID=2724914 RepID=UPI001442DBBE|nr:TlpA family protein disulfide reductase [Leifsonia sp. PS1209]QJA00222.1 redoxin domain-containing protein [Leifsonia sp. PS1209]
MTRRNPRTWPIVAAATVVLVGFCAVLVAAAQPPSGSEVAPSSAPAAPGISTAAASLLQLDPLGNAATKAPAYSLTDQHGNAMIPDTFRGRSVVLTFNDDECQDLCTLLAQDVALADHDLGAAASRVAFVSINANPYHPAVSDVASWSASHGLGDDANWYFGTGSPATLAAAAQAYGVPIQLDAADQSVVHGTEIFFIDPSGVERALGQFGTDSASTAPFAHTMAQEAVDLLPAAQRRTVAGSAAVDLSADGTGVGAKPKPFSLPALNGSGHVGAAAPAGRYTVLNFWASTCTACIGELADLQKISNEFTGRADLIGIDVSDDTTAARATTRQAGTGYPLAVDANGSVAGQYRISGLPYTVILDPTGRVAIRHPGAFTAEQLEYVLDSLVPPATK